MANDDLVSVIIASRNEKYTQRTIDDLLSKAGGPVEIILILDGWWPDPQIKDDARVHILHNGVHHGLRAGINSGAQLAHGKYLMKTDAHCMFEQGWDLILKSDCDSDWLCVPRRVSLDGPNWCIANTGRQPVDYEFISYPYVEMNTTVRVGNVWKDRARERLDVLIDDDMSFQGSCWFTHKSYFLKTIAPLQEENYGTFILESEEVGNKVWLSGGRVIINKKTKYAHWHKGKENGRGYFVDRRDLIRGRRFHIDYWMNNKWPGLTRKFEWLVDHFWPVPTWPENWKELEKTISWEGWKASGFLSSKMLDEEAKPK